MSYFNDENGMKNNNDLEDTYEYIKEEKNYIINEGQEETLNTGESINIYGIRAELEQLEKSLNRKSRKRFISGTLAGLLLGSVITLGATYTLLPNMLNMQGISLDNAVPQEITINPSQDLTVYTAVAKKVMPAVVGITTVELKQDWFYGIRKVPGVGTGVIVDKRGYILTNSHVVGDGNAEEVMVLLNDGRQLNAEILWNEKSLDLAIIKVEDNNLHVAELGDSDVIEVGEIAIAIGNPLGLSFQRSLTQGIISGLNRTITESSSGETIENLIQTDASINPGNSGGPLLNAKGQIIGINTVKVTSGEGLGFAIPINMAKPIVDQFIEKGEFTRVYLGIQGVNIDVFESVTGVRLPSDKGVYVAQAIENSVATKYGIMQGDIITKIGDNDINKMSDLVRAIYKYRPGDKTTVTIIRNNNEVKIDVVFD